MKKVFNNYIVDFILALLSIALGVIMLPVLFGLDIINIILAIGLVLYLALFLFGRLTRRRGAMFVIILLEFMVVAVIATGLVLQQFKIFNISGVCQIIGLVLWLHSAGMLMGEYFTARAKDAKRTPPYIFALHILLVSLGTYMFAAPFISDELIAWIISIGLMTLGVALIALAIYLLPKKKKSSKK